MKKTIFHLWEEQLFSMPTLFLLILGLGLQEQASAQQWAGSSILRHALHREGKVGIGYPDTTEINQNGILGLNGNLYFKNSNEAYGLNRYIYAGSRNNTSWADNLVIQGGGVFPWTDSPTGNIRGGSLNLLGGAAFGNGTSGSVQVQSGDASGTGSTGNITIKSGSINSGGTGLVGNIRIEPGNHNEDGFPGNVEIFLPTTDPGQWHGNIRMATHIGSTFVEDKPSLISLENGLDARFTRFLVQNNIGTINETYNGTQFPMKDRVGHRANMMGDSKVFTQDTANAGIYTYTGFHSFWDKTQAHFGTVGRKRNQIRDAFINWQGVINAEGDSIFKMEMDPDDVPHFSLRFTGVTDPIADNRYLTYNEVLDILPNGHIGIGRRNPQMKIDALFERGQDVVPSGFVSGYRFVHKSTIGENGGLSGMSVNALHYGIGDIPKGSSSKGIIGVSDGGAENNIGLSGSAQGKTSKENNIGMEGLALEGDARTNRGVYGRAVEVSGTGSGNFSAGVYGENSAAGDYSNPTDLKPPSYIPSDNSRNWGLYSQGDIGAMGGIFAASDKRLKEKIVEEKHLSKIRQLKVYSYNFRTDGKALTMGLNSKQKHIGFMAQELKEVYPALVQTKNFGRNSKEGKFETGEFLAVNYQEIIPATVAAVQELADKLDSLQTRINKLEEVNKVITGGFSSKLESKLKGGLDIEDPYPNPTGEYTTLSIIFPNDCAAALLTIFNLNGKVIYEQTVNSEASTIKLLAKDWGKGVFILNVSAPLFKSSSKSIVVQ